VPALLSLIEAGVGVGAVPRLALVGGASSSLVGVPLVDPVIVRSVGIVRLRGRPLGSAPQALYDMLKAHANPVRRQTRSAQVPRSRRE